MTAPFPPESPAFPIRTANAMLKQSLQRMRDRLLEEGKKLTSVQGVKDFSESMIGPGVLGAVGNQAAGKILFRGGSRAAHETAVKNLAELVDRARAYRGMTKTEYDATLGSGHGVRSRQDYSVPGEGTSFADDIADAESYANFGRDDPRKTNLPTYLVEVLKNERLRRDPRDGYLKAAEEVPPEDITRVWQMEPDDAGNVVGSLVEFIKRLQPK